MPERLELGELLGVLREHLPDLRQRYGVHTLSVFGSVARGSAVESSDLDLLIRFESDPPGLLRFLELESHLSDLLNAARKAQEFSAGLSYGQFGAYEKTVYAVVRALEIVGEASKQVAPGTRERAPDVPWRSMTGMRDKLIHAYSGIDLKVVWRTIRTWAQLHSSPLKVAATDSWEVSDDCLAQDIDGSTCRLCRTALVSPGPGWNILQDPPLPSTW